MILQQNPYKMGNYYQAWWFNKTNTFGLAAIYFHTRHIGIFLEPIDVSCFHL